MSFCAQCEHGRERGLGREGGSFGEPGKRLRATPPRSVWPARGRIFGLCFWERRRYAWGHPFGRHYGVRRRGAFTEEHGDPEGRRPCKSQQVFGHFGAPTSCPTTSGTTEDNFVMTRFGGQGGGCACRGLEGQREPAAALWHPGPGRRARPRAPQLPSCWTRMGPWEGWVGSILRGGWGWGKEEREECQEGQKGGWVCWKGG